MQKKINRINKIIMKDLEGVLSSCFEDLIKLFVNLINF